MDIHMAYVHAGKSAWGGSISNYRNMEVEYVQEAKHDRKYILKLLFLGSTQANYILLM